MTRLERLWAMRGVALSGLERFPVALLWLAAFVVLINLEIAGAVELEGELIAQAGAASGAAAAVATAWILLSERRSLAAPLRHGVSFLLAAVFGAAIWFWQPLAVASAALLTAAVLAVPLAPYLQRAGEGFWSFFWALMHAGALAFLAVIIFCAGLSAILASLEYLFNLDVESSIYGHVWSIGLGFVGPLFALALVPAQFPEGDLAEPNDVFITAIRILADFVAIPLLAAYALILHAYALKILITGEVPRNQIGWMVLSFGLAVMTLRILVHPLRAVGRRSTRLFLRFWTLPLVVPLMLLAGAVAQRISQYGVTPERYGVALFAVFLAGVLLSQIHPRWRGDIRVMPTLGATCLLVASFGPWGMLSVSARSQTGRLLEHLAAADALEGGRLVRQPNLDFAAATDIDSIVHMLDEIGQLDRLRPLFANRADNPFVAAVEVGLPNRLALLVSQQLGADLATARHASNMQSSQREGGNFWTDPSGPTAVPVAGYDLMVPFVAWQGPGTAIISVPETALRLEISNFELAVSDRYGRVVLPQEAIRQAVTARLNGADTDASRAADPIFLELTAEGRKVAVLLENLGGQIVGNRLQLESGRMILLLRRADWAI